jgi:hypothetical protein
MSKQHRDRAEHPTRQPARPPVPVSAPPAPAGPRGADVVGLPALLSAPQLAGRANGPVRQAVLMHLQRTRGNQATRQAVAARTARAAPTPGCIPAPRPVQRTVPYHEPLRIDAQHREQFTSTKRITQRNRSTFSQVVWAEFERINNDLLQHPTSQAYTDLHLRNGIKAYRVRIAQALNEGYYDDAYQMEQVRAAVNVIFRELERVVSGVPAPTVTMPNVKIGNEFTFTNPKFKEITKKAVKSGWKEEQARGKYAEEFEKVLAAWDTQMKAYGFKAVDGVDKYNYATKEYTLDQINWSYKATFDDAVIELVTTPVEAVKLTEGEIAEAMDRYIFGVANTLNLEAGKDAGSGHINIDRVSAFESGEKDLAEFLEAFYNDKKFWTAQDPDYTNAPFPDELTPKRQGQAKQVIDKYKGKLRQNYNVKSQEFVGEMMTQVFDVSNVQNKPDMKPHFQAVNLEHYQEQNPEERRVEVRRVPAQYSRAELLTHLNRLFGLMKK